MKKIIIDAQKHNLTILTFEGTNVHNSVTETAAHIHKKTNIYKGLVTNIKYNIEAAFIDYGTRKCGLMPISELIEKQAIPTEKNNDKNTVLAQIVKEEKNNKGVTLTANISLIGYHLILLPKSPYKIGISKKLSNTDRKQLCLATKNLNIPTEMGIIIRTNASKATAIDLALDLDILIEQWLQIKKLFLTKKAPSILYQESNKIVQTIRDNIRADVCDIIVSNKKILKLTLHYTKNLQESITKKLTYHTPVDMLLKKFKLSENLDINSNTVYLPSGGLLYIEKTEALVSVDINSGKINSKKNADNTALKTNVEATDEIARQLRLRNLSGLIIIDYIDMQNKKHNDLIVERMLKATSHDTAKIKIGKISEFGILELSRQQTNEQRKKIQEDITILNTKKLQNIWEKIPKKNKIHYTLIVTSFTDWTCFKKMRLNTQRTELVVGKQVVIIPKKEIKKTNLNATIFSTKLKTSKNFKNLYESIL